MLNGKRILLVDSEIINRVVLKAMLNRLFGGHHSCVEANSGTEALDILKKEHVDLVIAQQHMHRMRGDVFAEQSKRLKPTIPVLLVTHDRQGLVPAKSA